MSRKEQLIAQLSAFLATRDESEVEIALALVQEFFSVLDGESVSPEVGFLPQ